MQQRFLLQILLLSQYVSGTIMPIIRSSRVLYSGCCLWYLVLRFSRCWSGVELWVVCPVCRMLQHSANISVEKVISFCKYKQWQYTLACIKFKKWKTVFPEKLFVSPVVKTFWYILATPLKGLEGSWVEWKWNNRSVIASRCLATALIQISQTTTFKHNLFPMHVFAY